MDFKPPSNLPELAKEWSKLTTGEEFCEIMQKYLLAQCELMNVALTKGITLNSVTGLNQQTGKFGIAALNYNKNFHTPT